MPALTLGVADVARGRAFHERLGRRASATSTADVAFFQAGGVVLSLHGRASPAEDARLPAEGSGFGGVALARNVESPAAADAFLRKAEAAGARLLKPAETAFRGGYSGYVADPDGHPWEVAWNPHFPLRPDGGVTLTG